MKKCLPKYNIGGILKASTPFLNMIPGVGPVLSAALGTIGGIIESDEQNKVEPTPIKVNYTKNPYATMKHGGSPNGFKQYSAPSHENGGQPIDEVGNVNFNKPTAEIETIENKYTYSSLPNSEGKTYVFSEQNGTAQQMNNIMKKYKNKNTDKDFLSKLAMELDIKKLEKINDVIKAENAPVEEMSQGGGLNVQTRRDSGYKQAIDGVFDNVLKGSQENLELLPDGGDPEIQLGIDAGKIAINPIFNRLAYPTNALPARQPTFTNTPIVTTSPNTIPYNASETKGFSMPKFNPGVASDLLKTGLTAFDVIKAATAKPETVDPRLVDYDKADDKVYSVNTDMTDIKNQALAANNQAVETINNNTTSQSQRMARLSGTYSNFGNVLSNIALQEQQQRNANLIQQGQYESGKAQDEANRLAVADEKMSMNRAATDQLKDVARQSITSYAQDLASKDFARQQTKHVFEQARLKTADSFALLNKLVTDFNLEGAEQWQKYLSNPSDENLKSLENSIKIKMK